MSPRARPAESAREGSAGGIIWSPSKGASHAPLAPRPRLALACDPDRRAGLRLGRRPARGSGPRQLAGDSGRGRAAGDVRLRRGPSQAGPRAGDARGLRQAQAAEARGGSGQGLRGPDPGAAPRRRGRDRGPRGHRRAPEAHRLHGRGASCTPPRRHPQAHPAGQERGGAAEEEGGHHSGNHVVARDGGRGRAGVAGGLLRGHGAVAPGPRRRTHRRGGHDDLRLHARHGPAPRARGRNVSSARPRRRPGACASRT